MHSNADETKIRNLNGIKCPNEFYPAHSESYFPVIIYFVQIDHILCVFHIEWRRNALGCLSKSKMRKIRIRAKYWRFTR